MNPSKQTVTFTTNCGRFQFTVKKEFLDRADVALTPVYRVVTEYNLPKYLHNTTGPATVNLETGNVEYYKDGKHLSKEEADKLINYTLFYDKMDGLINND